MSATSEQASPRIPQLYQSLQIRNIDWINLAKQAINGKSPYDKISL